jgi:hypothetical protein
MLVTGDVRAFADGFGKPLEAPEVQAAMALAGFPAARTEIDVPGLQRTYLTTSDGAVDFVFENCVLRTVIVCTQQSGGGAYPRKDALLDGLSAEATRAQVRALLGKPEWVSEDPQEEADQFAVDGYFVHVIYVGDRAARWTIMLDDPAEW